MKEIAIIFPNQLHRDSEVLEKKIPVYLIEEFLFFNQYNFHKQKIVFHRSSMKEYESYLINKSINAGKQALGAMYVLGSLTLVSKNAAESLPALYLSLIHI